MKQKQTDREKKIAGIRLENVIKEKGVSRREVIKALNLQGHEEVTEQKMSDYIAGRRPIPLKYAEEISRYLNIDLDFLTDITSFHAFTDNSYSEYIESKNLTALISDVFYEKYKAISRLYGYSLGVYGNGDYELYDTEGFKLKLSKSELCSLYEDVRVMAHKQISKYKKGGDADGSV